MRKKQQTAAKNDCNNIIRINKMFSICGIMSRRATEKAILEKRIKVNEKVAQIGMKINPEKDKIEFDGRIIKLNKPFPKIYLMLNKPRGYISSLKDEHSRRTVADLLTGIGTRVYNIGRLDRNSEGLLLFTNDGEFANKIMHPKNKIVKRYKVTVSPKINETQLTKLGSELIIDREKIIPAEVSIDKEYEDRTILNIAIKQGKNQQIRKMCKITGLNVKKLKRVSIGQLKLGMLAVGRFRYLKAEEIAKLKEE